MNYTTARRLPKPSIPQLIWGSVVLPTTVLFTAGFALAATVSGWLLRLLAPSHPHLRKWVVYPYSWVMRVIMWCAAARATLDLSEYERPPAGTPVISADIHPDNLGTLLHSWVKTALYGLRWMQVCKVELITGDRPFDRLAGFGVQGFHGGVFIDRSNPAAAVKAMREQVEREPGVVICTMIDGTRPKVRDIIKGRAYLTSQGFGELARRLLYTACPRVRGFYELRRAMPAAAVVSVWAASSHHCETLTDIFRLFFGGGVHFKVVNWCDAPVADLQRSWEELSSAEQAAFSEAVYRFFIDRAHRWMQEVRVEKESPVALATLAAAE